jgi:hypothetical protein
MSAFTWNDPRLASSEPVPVEAAIPAFAGATPKGFLDACSALPTSITPAPAPLPNPPFLYAVLSRIPLTTSGVRDGLA